VAFLIIFRIIREALMDLNELANLSEEFIALRNGFLRTNYRHFYKDFSGEVVYRIPSDIYWTKDTGIFCYTEQPKYPHNFKDTHSETEDIGNGQYFTHFWYYDWDRNRTDISIPYQVPVEDELLYVGHYCINYSPEERSLHKKEFELALHELNHSRFEKFLNTTREYKRIISDLHRANVIHDTHGCFPEPQKFSKDRDFEITIIDIIAHGLLAFCDPLRPISNYHGRPFKRSNHVSVKEIKPDQRTQKAAKKLLDLLDDQGLHGETLRNHLRRIIDGEPPLLLPSFEVDQELNSKALVAQVSILSFQRLTISNGKNNNFPVKAMQAILNLVDTEASERTIQRYQSEINTERSKVAQAGY